MKIIQIPFANIHNMLSQNMVISSKKTLSHPENETKHNEGKATWKALYEHKSDILYKEAESCL